MMNAVRDEKAALRREIFAARAAMPFDRRKAADAAITEALKGIHVKGRVEELIKIAHPDFREWLRTQADRMELF